MSAPAAPAAPPQALPDDPQAQYTLALHLRVRRPAALGPLAAHMVRTAGDDPFRSGRVRVVRGWHELATGPREAARLTADEAVRRRAHCQDPAAQALVRRCSTPCSTCRASMPVC